MFLTQRTRLIFFVLLICVFVFSHSALGQDKSKSDSLKNSLLKANHDTTKLNILIDLAISYGSSHEKNLYYLTQAHELATKTSNTKKIASIEDHLATYYYYSAQYDKAIIHTQKASTYFLAIIDSSRYIKTLNNLGILFRKIGNLQKSLIYNQTILDYYEKKSDSINLAKTYNNVGILYKDYGDEAKSLSYHKKALTIRKLIEDQEGLGSSYNNIATLYQDQKKIDSSIYYYQLALNIHEFSNSVLLGAVYNNIAVAYKEKNELNKAEYYYIKSLNYRDSMGNNHGMSQSRNNLAELNRLKKNFELAEEYGRQGLAIAKEYNYTEEIWRGYLHLAHIYRDQKKYKEAYEYIDLYAKVKDSMRNSEEIRKMAQVEVAHSYNQKMLEDSLRRDQEQQLFLKEQEMEKITLKEGQRRQQVIIWFGLVGGLILFVFVIFLVKNNREKSRANAIISTKNAEIEIQKVSLEIKNKEVLDSINYARRIQHAILPTEGLMKEVLPEHFLIFMPKDIISGDFYWMHESDDSIFLAVADCTGHGVPGAIVSVICANALSKSIEEGNNQTGEILDRTRELVVDQLSKNNSTVQDGMDISFVRFITDENKDVQKLQWSGANNPLWILRKNSQEIEELKPNKQPIGKYENAVSFETNEVEIEKGDTIYLFTDGLADQFGGEKGKKFKRANFKSLLMKSRHKSLSHQKMDIINAFDEWKGNVDQIDDICVMGIRF
jgi:serine phosphatase RsbU (regulator of sigma subunit)/tetratricopeptide (TPR) repeat protein